MALSSIVDNICKLHCDLYKKKNLLNNKLGSGGGLSDIFNSFGNRGSTGNRGGFGSNDFGGGSSGGGSGLTDILFGRGGAGTRGGAVQPQPQPQPGSGGSSNGGFLSGLSSIFGK